MKARIRSLTPPDGFWLTPNTGEYIVLFRFQNTHIEGIGTAAFDGAGWHDCSEPGQPIIVQYFSPVSGRFENWR